MRCNAAKLQLKRNTRGTPVEEIIERNEDAYSSCAYSFRVAHSFLLATSTFPIMHLICPPQPHPKFCISNFSWDGCMPNFFLVGGVNEVHQGKCGSGVCDSKGSLKFRPRKDRRYYTRQIHRLPSNILSLMKWSCGREVTSSQQADNPLLTRLPLSLNLFCWNFF